MYQIYIFENIIKIQDNLVNSEPLYSYSTAYTYIQREV